MEFFLSLLPFIALIASPYVFGYLIVRFVLYDGPCINPETGGWIGPDDDAF